jgi:1,4-alpha-glucan branching enzyme
MTSLKSDGRIEFRFYRPGATKVAIAGTFNGWSQRDLLMRQTGDGWWTLEVEIEPGEHQFRYFADGAWYTDFAANGIEYTKFGCNSVLVVPGERRQGLRLAM